MISALGKLGTGTLPVNKPARCIMPSGHGFAHEEIAYGAFCIYEEEKRNGRYSGQDANWFAAIDRLTQIRARATVTADPMNGVKTVIWLGAGASYGSQLKTRAKAPPLTQTFFKDSSVQVLMPLYPVLTGVWQAFGRPSDLESFWQDLDKGFDSPNSLPSCNIDDLVERLRQSVTLLYATEERRNYYHYYLDRLSVDPPANYKKAVAVAGWELKLLLIDLLNQVDWDLTLHQHLFGSVRGPFSLVTFNYDTIAEQALERIGFGFTYEEPRNGCVVVSKPHGSIQWNWRKPSNEFFKLRTKTSQSAFGITRDDVFQDPLMIGLRTKRELTGEDTSEAVNRFWSEPLAQARTLLQDARRVIVVGFAFQEADKYLWDELSARKVGAGKVIHVCDKKSASDRGSLVAKITRFFETPYVTAFWEGFTEEFVATLKRA